MASRGAAISLAALSLVAAAPAIAQEQGVNPESPAGVEYALPLDTARGGGAPGREGDAGGGTAGGGDSGSSSSGEAPLFGAGIGPAGQGGPGSDRRRQGSARKNADRQSDGSSSVTTNLGLSTPKPLGDDGGSATAEIIGAAAMTLLLGLGAGALVRRARRAT